MCSLITFIDLETGHTHVPGRKCDSQRTNLGTQFSPFSMWASGSELSLSGLLAGAFIS